MHTDEPKPHVAILEPIEIPPAKSVPPEEIMRRRALFAQVMERRAKIGLIEISTEELVRQIRDESDDGE